MPEQPASLAAFLSEAPERASHALSALSVAAALTDEVAVMILGAVGHHEAEAATLVEVLHQADFIRERNSEWHLAPDARRWLLWHARENTLALVSKLLLDLRGTAVVTEATSTFPKYLLTEAGNAYHTAFLDNKAALGLYEASVYLPPSQRWMLAALAREQRELGVLQPSAIEPLFLQGMNLYLEGRYSDALLSLWRVARSRGKSREVVTALHLCGVILHREKLRIRTPERVFRRALALARERGEARSEAVILNSLGNLLRVKDGENAFDEARHLLGTARRLAATVGDARHAVFVANTLALLFRQHGAFDRAIGWYDEAISIAQNEKVGDYDLDLARRSRKNLAKWKRRIESVEVDRRRSELAAFHLSMGKGLMRSDDPFAARQHLQRALAGGLRVQDTPKCHASLASVYFRLRLYAEAEGHFRKALSLGLDDARLRAKLGRCLAELGAPLEMVEAEYRAALSMEAENSFTLSWYALALRRYKNRQGEAEAMSARALASQPNSSVLLNNHGIVLSASSDPAKWEEALRTFRRALYFAHPAFNWPRVGLRRIRNRLRRRDGRIELDEDIE